MTDLKICGIRSQKDYHLIQASGADYLGFIFANSKRKVTPEQVQKWIQNQNHDHFKHPVKHVGVFVNPKLKHLDEVLSTVDLDVIQLHGDESESLIEGLRSITDKEIWKALPHSESTIQKIKSYSDIVDGFVIDTKVKGKWGGTGIQFDWKAIPKYQSITDQMEKKCFIAGGINPNNVQDCLFYGPHGIDLSSGIETDEGKDPTLLGKLMERMNNYEHDLSR